MTDRTDPTPPQPKIIRWIWISGIERHWLRRLLMLVCLVPLIMFGYLMLLWSPLLWIVLRAIAGPFYSAWLGVTSMLECWNSPRIKEPRP